ncbi:MAG TPA: cupin domain-containing protein [Azospirillaceae bacterium]|nr:cupin domain-containing protein [Azospirillaceae bacterium]
MTGRPTDAVPLVFHLADASAALERQGHPRFVEMGRHGTMSVELYAPRGTDPQQPHKQDELYVVVSGTGRFLCADRSTPFGPGDVLFAPAGAVHRFEDFSDDLAVWVIFYGPQGGEAP